MTSRLDRLLLLLDTGSSTSVRTTAAKQLAQLAAKSVTNDIAFGDEIKTTRQHAALCDPSAWAELMAVVARILPYLHSKSYESRSAASTALSQIFTLTPLWQPAQDSDSMSTDQPLPLIPEYPNFSVQELVIQNKLLLASSGKEFIRPVILASSAEVKKARKEAMGRLGLEFLDDVADDLDLEKELADNDADLDVDMELKVDAKVEIKAEIKAEVDDEESSSHRGSVPPPPTPDTVKATLKVESVSRTRSATPAEPSPTTSSTTDPPPDSAMSARERNRLKRKNRDGNSAFVTGPPPQAAGSKYKAAAAGPNKARLVAPEEAPQASRLSSPANGYPPEKVVVDPTKGGAIMPKEVKQAKALEVESGLWIWDGLVKVLEVDLFSAAWEVRHGAAMALRELLKIQGKYGGMQYDAPWEVNQIAHEKWCNDLSAQVLCVFVLDRFGDFVSDQVIAPVREMASQTLASLLIHMPRRSLLHVHSVLLQMIQQNFAIPPTPAIEIPKPRGGRGKALQKQDPAQKTYIWEIRHAGLLGIKYEVAVRSDLFTETSVKTEDQDCDSGKDILQGVVESAILGLGDHDDDVRSVAASCLLPIASHVVEQLPDSLDRVLLVLWRCLSDMKDDLSSSVGAVMDLLGKLVHYETVIAILAREDATLPLSTLAPTLYPFFRHTIANVRLAVVKTLHSFMEVPSLPRGWIDAPFLQLLVQNLISEERSDIREESLKAWRTAISILAISPDRMISTISQDLMLQWYAVAMTPLGAPIDTTSFYRPNMDTEGTLMERHNVDKIMLSQDMALITEEVTLKARIASATALAQLIGFWPAEPSATDDFFSPILIHYIDSSSMIQKFLSGVIGEEWARLFDELNTMPSQPLREQSVLARDLSTRALSWLQAPPPPAYHEMAYPLHRIHADCVALLHCFHTDCKLPISSIPFLGNEVDITGSKTGCFTIESAKEATGSIFIRLKDSLGRAKKKELSVISEKRLIVMSTIDRYLEAKAEHDIRVSAAFASAFVALKTTPDKVSPVVKGIMNGVKSEENFDLQKRSAIAVAAFVDFCASHQISQPPDKIVKNLCTFLCQDTDQTPTFSIHRKTIDGILSFQTPIKEAPKVTQKNGNAKDKDKEKEKDKEKDKSTDVVKAEDLKKARLSRRGAQLAFGELSHKFNASLFHIIPNMWQSMAGGLLSTFKTDSAEDSDILIEKQFGQDVIDSLSVLEAVTPALHQDLWPQLEETFPMMLLALRSRFAIVRQSAARCFSVVCDVVTTAAMKFVVENVLPLLGDPLNLANRQGIAELVYHIVQRLDIKALPYVIFMVVPVLGRMSDADDDIRATATNTFASLVKMVPLEAGLPDPPEFPKELLERRDNERQFLTQLLDGTKVEQYDIPVEINAELRKYQQDGINWLAFLAKYQLHGILCDDMGLGKTLQSICILASKHFERKKKYEETKDPNSVHLCSMIICPPTLTGHWYYEILKYATNLKPILYTGNARERAKIVNKFKSHDIVITSYEVVRNDINNLESHKWLYCILDEGHVIKNAKTKLTKAVKQINAQHRVILSGTPIQNNVLELWSLFDFLMPGFLGTESSFSERFSKPILSNRDGKSKNDEAAALALEALHKQVLPFLLRRLKEDVLNDLPPKIIQDYYCDLSEMQKGLYDDFGASSGKPTEEDINQPSQEGKPQQHIFQSLQYLRKLCNHPALVLKNEEAVTAALTRVGSNGALSDIQHAPKLLALRQLLTDCGIGVTTTSTADHGKSELIDTGTDHSSSPSFSQHRVLIFCQMKQMLDIIENDLFKPHMPSVTYMRLDGGTPANKRHAVVQTFNADPSIDCLLLTTHVGGLGLTLTGADTVIFVEHDWNPMKDLQAMDRAHRLGQKKVVNVYRLITKGTLEEKIMGLQRFKLNIANSIITQQNSGMDSMDTDLVLDLFRRTTAEEDAAAAAKKKAKEASGPVSQKNLLAGLEDLPAEDEYEGLDLSSFMGSIGK